MKKIIASILMVGVFGFQSLFAMAGGQNPNEQLLQGAENGNLEQVQAALKQHADVNAVNFLNVSALMFAVSNRHYNVAQYLLEKGADSNLVDNMGYTSLHYAVLKSLPDMVKLLLDNGVDPTLRNTNGQTPADMLALVQQPYFQRILKYFTEAARPTSEEMMGSLAQTATLH